ncbi:FxLYD domain-containing protein [Thalassobacillus hwangdonensis]|uniref:FxLYD domain-containing protein n=1 Tax=Thalassobacillus hwangdonensis TaxID=546108 RepID=A0ABW3KXT8_9BACI
MYQCPSCETQIQEGSRFCPNCGKQLDESPVIHNEELTATASEVDTSSEHQKRATKKEKPKRTKWIAILLPILFLILAGAGVGYTYAKETRINDDVMEMKQQAEALALEEKYDEAESLLSKAIAARPDYEALHEDLRLVRAAIVMNNEVVGTGKLIQQNSLEKAKENLNRMNQQVSEEDNRLFSHFVPELNEMDSKITVKAINNELADLSTVDQLAAKLSTLSTLNLEEATQVKNKIIDKIVTIASGEAEELIRNKEFSEAIQTVDYALQYAVNNDKLTQLKQRINEEQEAFVQAQNERIERAMERAAKEDLKNRTAAVEVEELNAEVDEFGDLTVTGKVKSVATKIISSITIEFTIFDKEGEEIGTESTTVYPMYLNPGDTGEFEKQYFGVEGEVTVEITNMRWYIE